MRELRRETLLPAKAGSESVEKAVERGRELAQLVVRLAEGEPAVEVVLAPRRRLASHPRDRLQGRSEQPARGEGDHDEHERAQY